MFTEEKKIREQANTVQPARNLHKPPDRGGKNFPRAVEHRGRTPVDRGGRPRGIIAVNGFLSSTLLLLIV